MDTLSLLEKMPKVDLHVHLDGSLKPATLFRLAADQGIPLPAATERELLPYVQAGDECGSLTEYLTKFAFVLPFLQTGEALEQVACEAVEDASRQRIRYLEIRFAPQLHRQRGLTPSDAIRHVLAGLRRGEERFGTKARCIAICMRNHSVADNLEVVEAAASFVGQGLVAVDLAGDESAHPASRFREVFGLAERLGIPATIHAGEAAGPDSIEEAVRRLGASRIGHGVRAKEDPAVLNLLRERRIPLELCPISNIQTKAVAGWASYPVREYFDQGLMLTVNTDNPGVSGTDLNKEYAALAERFGFTASEIATLILNGVEAAFLPPEEKAELRREFEGNFAALGIAASGAAPAGSAN